MNERKNLFIRFLEFVWRKFEDPVLVVDKDHQIDKGVGFRLKRRDLAVGPKGFFRDLDFLGWPKGPIERIRIQTIGPPLEFVFLVLAVASDLFHEATELENVGIVLEDLGVFGFLPGRQRSRGCKGGRAADDFGDPDVIAFAIGAVVAPIAVAGFRQDLDSLSLDYAHLNIPGYCRQRLLPALLSGAPGIIGGSRIEGGRFHQRHIIAEALENVLPQERNIFSYGRERRR